MPYNLLDLTDRQAHAVVERNTFFVDWIRNAGAADAGPDLQPGAGGDRCLNGNWFATEKRVHGAISQCGTIDDEDALFAGLPNDRQGERDWFADNIQELPKALKLIFVDEAKVPFEYGGHSDWEGNMLLIFLGTKARPGALVHELGAAFGLRHRLNLKLERIYRKEIPRDSPQAKRIIARAKRNIDRNIIRAHGNPPKIRDKSLLPSRRAVRERGEPKEQIKLPCCNESLFPKEVLQALTGDKGAVIFVQELNRKFESISARSDAEKIYKFATGLRLALGEVLGLENRIEDLIASMEKHCVGKPFGQLLRLLQSVVDNETQFTTNMGIVSLLTKTRAGTKPWEKIKRKKKEESRSGEERPRCWVDFIRVINHMLKRDPEGENPVPLTQVCIKHSRAEVEAAWKRAQRQQNLISQFSPELRRRVGEIIAGSALTILLILAPFFPFVTGFKLASPGFSGYLPLVICLAIAVPLIAAGLIWRQRRRNREARLREFYAQAGRKPSARIHELTEANLYCVDDVLLPQVPAGLRPLAKEIFIRMLKIHGSTFILQGKINAALRRVGAGPLLSGKPPTYSQWGHALNILEGYYGDEPGNDLCANGSLKSKEDVDEALRNKTLYPVVWSDRKMRPLWNNFRHGLEYLKARGVPVREDLKVFVTWHLHCGACVLTDDQGCATGIVFDRRVLEEPRKKFGHKLEGVKRYNQWVIAHEIIASQGGLSHEEVKALQESIQAGKPNRELLEKIRVAQGMVKDFSSDEGDEAEVDANADAGDDEAEDGRDGGDDSISCGEPAMRKKKGTVGELDYLDRYYLVRLEVALGIREGEFVDHVPLDRFALAAHLYYAEEFFNTLPEAIAVKARERLMRIEEAMMEKFSITTPEVLERLCLAAIRAQDEFGIIRPLPAVKNLPVKEIKKGKAKKRKDKPLSPFAPDELDAPIFYSDLEGSFIDRYECEYAPVYLFSAHTAYTWLADRLTIAYHRIDTLLFSNNPLREHFDRLCRCKDNANIIIKVSRNLKVDSVRAVNPHTKKVEIIFSEDFICRIFILERMDKQGARVYLAIRLLHELGHTNDFVSMDQYIAEEKSLMSHDAEFYRVL
ncbi:MAG: hypothetical protein PHD04_05095, partial [Candidatus Pacebacteria bacterium]|nr:hypothetical protein [Candidatus Paceibacterota bacterium]